MFSALLNRFRRNRRNNRGERGAALVEFGLVAPILVTLSLGAVTTGAVVSATVNVAAVVLVRPHASVAVNVTDSEPLLRQR